MKENKIIFFHLVDDKAYEFVAKKVARLNGDIRVAFDMMKTALSTLAFDLNKSEELPLDSEIKITLARMLKIYEQKYGSKIGENLKNQPKSNILILQAAVELFETIGED